MTPASNTLFALALFFALALLNLWTRRRHRRPVSTPPSEDRSVPESPGRAGHTDANAEIAHALPSSGR